MSDDSSQPAVQAGKVDANTIWLRMIKRYVVSIVAGLIILYFVFPALYADSETLPPPLLVASIAGGLMFLGGLFGLALSTFFYYLHKK